ncbi:hypothetical protein HanRHA438_Chr03g0117381 [Helianthus annuus]|nr:hypothetical protein HanRHA438_Chr03g0117381 [Helianthus annuus]
MDVEKACLRWMEETELTSLVAIFEQRILVDEADHGTWKYNGMDSCLVKGWLQINFTCQTPKSVMEWIENND